MCGQTDSPGKRRKESNPLSGSIAEKEPDLVNAVTNKDLNKVTCGTLGIGGEAF